MKPTITELKEALLAAGKAHHEYQTDYLNGKNDEYWAGWYAAFVIGKLGDFTTPTNLTILISEVAAEEGWFEEASEFVHNNL